MVNPISNNSLIAALFGTGTARSARGAGAASGTGSAPSAASAGDHPQPVDRVDLSAAGLRASATGGTKAPSAPKSAHSATGLGGETKLTDEERQKVKKLKQRDTEVRRHEAAHKAAAGSNAAGGATFEFTTGPDGKRYAVGGEVQIDTSEVKGDPRRTIQKMQQIRRAALAPASPSGKDRAVAAQAGAAERKARAELAEERRAQAPNGDGQAKGSTDVTGSPGGSDSSKRSVQPSNATARPNVTTQANQGVERIGEILDVIA